MAGLLPTPSPKKALFTSSLTEAVKPKRTAAPSKLRRNADRLAAYNEKKRAALIKTCAKSLAQSQITARVKEMQEGLEKIQKSYKETLARVTGRLNAKIAQLEKRIRDKDQQFTDLHFRTIAPLERLRAAEETAREAKRSMWIKDRSVNALRRILKSCGFRVNHQGYCGRANYNGRYKCDCGRNEQILAKDFIADIVRLCDAGKHEQAEMMVFGDVLKKKGERKHSSEEPRKSAIEHDCSKSPFCFSNYCAND